MTHPCDGCHNPLPKSRVDWKTCTFYSTYFAFCTLDCMGAYLDRELAEREVKS